MGGGLARIASAGRERESFQDGRPFVLRGDRSRASEGRPNLAAVAPARTVANARMLGSVREAYRPPRPPPMHPIWIVAVFVLGLVALVLSVAAFVPRKHAVSVRARYDQPPKTVWSVITNIDAIPTWRSDVRSVQRLPDVDGRPAWIEHSKHGAIPLEVVESEAPRKLVTRIADHARKLSFGGTWTWHLREVSGGSELTITENGFISNSLFRVLTHYGFGYTRTIEACLRDLGAKFGETTEPRVV